MPSWQSFIGSFTTHGDIWLVTTVLVVAAVIDGWQLKVPNWLTFPFIISGWIFWFVSNGFQESGWSFAYGFQGLGWSLLGTFVGLALLLPAYAIGGMGAGDVKLLAGVGAWVCGTHTFHAFCISAIVGGIIALGMVISRRKLKHHSKQFKSIAMEIVTIRDPEQLAIIAAERKKTMMLLPYGIPIAIGTITYFIWAGMLP
jgi:prepilin peptidase CpaA